MRRCSSSTVLTPTWSCASSAQLHTWRIDSHSARSPNRARKLQLIRAELPSNGCPQPSGSSKKMPASGISSELSAHQMAPAGAIAHSRARLCPRASSLSFFLPRLATPAHRLGVIGPWRPSVFHLLLRRYGRRSSQPSSSSLARRACVHVLPFSLVLLFFLPYDVLLRVLVFLVVRRLVTAWSGYASQ